jgi:hypothetical protein
VLVVEKGGDSAEHQSGRNSNVIHSGIYYEPGSLKAQLCKSGASAAKLFASEHGVPLVECGKLAYARTLAAVTIETDRGPFVASYAVFCGGLQADRLGSRDWTSTFGSFRSAGRVSRWSRRSHAWSAGSSIRSPIPTFRSLAFTSPPRLTDGSMLDPTRS